MTIYLVLFLFSWVLTLTLTPGVRQLAFRVKAVDVPEDRKIHQDVVPRLGGLSLYLTFLGSFALGYYFNFYLHRDSFPYMFGVILGATIIVALGIYDDIKNASPLVKLAVQTVAALIAIHFGAQFSLLSNPLAEEILDYFNLGYLSLPLSLLWIVGLTNAMNLIDGLDGLATGLALFASTSLFFISLNQKVELVPYFYVILIGSTLAFLKYNRYPAKIFLGDTGSMFLGYLLACLSVRGTQKSFTVAALFIPLLVFGVPIFDTTVSLFRRYMNGSRVSEADREHIHHRLLRFGLNQRQVVYSLYFISVLLGIIAFSFTILLDEYAALIVVVLGILGGVLGKELNLFGLKRRSMERMVKVDEK
ncbi:MAG: undecaprenyl/decaprenyl-phosphate alpha-N-acetylglucosaminyl 1-phosphate transferase [Acidobacteria bacterium]|nr:undecaprenyl/decaprenyl-phosphate alpha-N-acetylglucosaminyl 1-phosphate transferase [Acidobacteriota bacterium]